MGPGVMESTEWPARTSLPSCTQSKGSGKGLNGEHDGGVHVDHKWEKNPHAPRMYAQNAGEGPTGEGDTYVASIADFAHLYAGAPTSLMLLAEFILNSQQHAHAIANEVCVICLYVHMLPGR